MDGDVEASEGVIQGSLPGGQLIVVIASYTRVCTSLPAQLHTYFAVLAKPNVLWLRMMSRSWVNNHQSCIAMQTPILKATRYDATPR